MRSELVARVHCGLQQLSTGDREILALRYLEQLSVEQIAEALNISKNTVTSRHLRAVQRLRVVLNRGIDG
jgi:RNA polymerase sigma-70 factor (ECF subfamily)